jgi:hypothetical protein
MKITSLVNHGAVHILPSGTPVYFERTLGGAIACIKSAKQHGGVARVCNGTTKQAGTLLYPRDAR